MTDAAAKSISAFFARPEDVEHATADLVAAGVPRDLIEVVVSPAANRAHYGGRARRLGSQMARFAGAGALIGLLVGAVLSVEIILVFPGADLPTRGLWLAQLLGPNVTMMVGAFLGAIFGAFRRRPAGGPLARATGRDEILVVARAQPPDRVDRAVAALEASGGRESLVADEPSRSRRRKL